MSEERNIFDLKSIPREIKAERIVLKNLDPTFENAKMVFNTIDKNREYLLEWLEWVEYSVKPEDTYDYMKGNFEDIKKEMSFDIFLEDNHIGRIGFFGKNREDGICEIGFFMAEKNAGKGYMTEAVKILEKELFSRGMNRIVIKQDVKNIGSKKVAEKSGYKLEGIQYQDCYVKRYNGYRDTYTNVKFKSDWEKEIK